MTRALTVEQAAEYLQLSPYTVRQWLRDGKIPGRKIGRVYRILESDLAALVGAEPVSKVNEKKIQAIDLVGKYKRPDRTVQDFMREKADEVDSEERRHKTRRILMLLGSKRDDILRIAQTHGASNVRIFGSVARGEADENSDIDFLVEFAPGTSLLQHGAMIADLEDLLGRKVDVAPEKNLKERIRERVLAEAIPL
jgi:excisionase family DNA binding protein